MTMATAKRILRRSLACVLLAGAAPLAAADDTDGTWAAAEMSPADLRAQVAADASSLVILDVRTPEEFASRHIDGAVNIPVDEIDRRKAEIDKLTGGDANKPIVVYCAAGSRAAVAKQALVAAGHTKVTNLGGISNWDKK